MTAKWGRYIWTACGAGWSVIAWYTDSIVAAIVAVGCLALAGLWGELFD